jgi:ribose/xylose/arabinose/galactoside ABC-type transport system permease subunit
VVVHSRAQSAKRRFKRQGVTHLGTLIIGVLANILNLTGVDPFVQQLFKGALIVAAVFIMSRTRR